MTTFIALSILIEGKGAIKVKDNFPVLVQSHGQSERGQRSHHVAGRQARADLPSSGAEAHVTLEKLVFGE